ncbi:hypothetical protein BH09MYX1_BH09MYX1_50980 [soil metagenome]
MTRRARTVRREQDRESAKLVAAKEKVAAFDEGASPDRPIALESASQVEVHASSMTCPICGDSYRVNDHTVLVHKGQSLRVAHVVSPQCGRERRLYFAIHAALPN